MTVQITPQFVADEFKRLENLWAWQAYQRALKDRYEEAVTAALQGVDTKTGEQLRCLLAVASSFHTALNLPTIIFDAVSKEAAKVEQEGQGT